MLKFSGLPDTAEPVLLKFTFMTGAHMKKCQWVLGSTQVATQVFGSIYTNAVRSVTLHIETSIREKFRVFDTTFLVRKV